MLRIQIRFQQIKRRFCSKFKDFCYELQSTQKRGSKTLFIRLPPEWLQSASYQIIVLKSQSFAEAGKGSRNGVVVVVVVKATWNRYLKSHILWNLLKQQTISRNEVSSCKLPEKGQSLCLCIFIYFNPLVFVYFNTASIQIFGVESCKVTSWRWSTEKNLFCFYSTLKSVFFFIAHIHTIKMSDLGQKKA